MPDSGELRTLRDAGNYIAGLPKREHSAPVWRAAIEALLLVAETAARQRDERPLADAREKATMRAREPATCEKPRPFALAGARHFGRKPARDRVSAV
jgi:hypothetical protein